MATRFDLLHGIRDGKVRGKIKLRRGGELGIAERRAVCKGTRQSVPSGGDVGAYRLEPGAGVFVRLLCVDGDRSER